MKVKLITAGGLQYRGKKYSAGDELEITTEFYNAHKSRFVALDNNLVMDGECEEIRNVLPEAKEEATAPKKAASKRRSTGPKE